MAKHAKYVELVLKEEGMPSHFLSGYEVLSDYRSDGKRKLFLRKPESAAVETPKPKPARKRKAKAIRELGHRAPEFRLHPVDAGPTNAKSQTGFTEADRG